MKKNDMNLLDSYKKSAKLKTSEETINRAYIIVLIGTLIVAGALWGVLMLQNYMIQQDIKEVESYIQNPEVIRQYNEVQKLQDEITILERIIAQLDSANTVFEFMPKFNSSVFAVIEEARPTTITVNRLSFNGTVIELDVTGTQVNAISDFTLNLLATEYFQEVSYNSYSLSGNNYSSKITCFLKGGQ